MEKNKKNDNNLGRILRAVAIILVVVAAGLLVVNQTLGFFYKAAFLATPCQLCGDLNPGVEKCIEELNSPRASYWTGKGWSDPFEEETNKNKFNITIDFNP